MLASVCGIPNHLGKWHSRDTCEHEAMTRDQARNGIKPLPARGCLDYHKYYMYWKRDRFDNRDYVCVWDLGQRNIGMGLRPL